jgi:hypothetical protein
MSWLAGLGAAIVVFLGSIFGVHTAPASTLSPSVKTPAAAPSAMGQAGVVANSSASHPSAPSTGSQPDIASLMRKIGCSDMSSCIAACTREGMTQACLQLQGLMSQGMSQGRTSSAYTTGMRSGPQNNLSGDVAFVGNNMTANAAALPDCPASNAVFDTTPMAFSDLGGIEPLGHMNGEHILPSQADHVYVDAKASEQSAPIYAPGNVTLLGIAESTGIAGADKGADSVKLYFSPCKSLMFVFQINTLSPAIRSAIAKLQPSDSVAGATVSNITYDHLDIPLKSGDEMGTVVNTTGLGGGADFGAVDIRSAPLQFIDQGQATGMLAQSYQHAVCPLDYFTSSLKSSLESYLTIKNAGANGIPACGSVMQDKPGTAQGDWYDMSAPAPQYQGINESALLAIAHYNLDPSKGIVSVGTALIPSQMLGTQLIFSPTHSGYINREPSEITPNGSVYCFDGPAGAGGSGPETHIDIEMVDVSTLKADYAPGMCPASPSLSPQTVTYNR